MRVLTVERPRLRAQGRHAVHGLPAEQGTARARRRRAARSAPSASEASHERSTAPPRQPAAELLGRLAPVPAHQPLQRPCRCWRTSLRDGAQTPLPARRFVPPPQRFARLPRITSCEGERLDHLAARYFGDPEQFWRICDANGAMPARRAGRGNRPRACASRCRRHPGRRPDAGNGIHLTLLIGPAVPVPAPAVVLDALDSVQVTSGGDRSGFQLTFPVGKNSPLQNDAAAGRLLRSDRRPASS